MTRHLIRLGLTIAAVGALGGCGVHIGSATPAAKASTTTSSTTTAPTTSTSLQRASGPTAPLFTAPARTVPQTTVPPTTLPPTTVPQATVPQAAGFNLSAAEQTIAGMTTSAGSGSFFAPYFSPNEVGRSPSDLYVIIADCSTGDGYCYQAFFFEGGTYIGTATSAPVLAMTSSISVVGPQAVTLSYPQYLQGDPNSSPSGGTDTYTFTYIGGDHVQASPPLPALAQINGPGG